MNTMNLPNNADAFKILHELANQKAVCTALKVNKALVLYGVGDLGKIANWL